jgi:hypothetical protein
MLLWGEAQCHPGLWAATDVVYGRLRYRRLRGLETSRSYTGVTRWVLWSFVWLAHDICIGKSPGESSLCLVNTKQILLWFWLCGCYQSGSLIESLSAQHAIYTRGSQQYYKAPFYAPVTFILSRRALLLVGHSVYNIQYVYRRPHVSDPIAAV